jgi:uncharacterized repeat protein (TIGR01451 family)
MKKVILTLAFLSALVFPSGVLADAYSQGEVNYNISIDKKIRPINDSNFYDNIDRDQKVFVNDDIIDYRIVVENTGKDILYNLTVTDYYPIVNQIILAPGEINKSSRQIVWKIDQLAAGESKTFTIRAKVINSSTWKSQTNVVEVRNNYVYDKDTATFYLNGKVIPVTGNTDLVVKSGIVISLSVIALALRKFARGY